MNRPEKQTPPVGLFVLCLLAMIPLIVIVVALLFLILELVPSDAADALAGPTATMRSSSTSAAPSRSST